MGCPRPLLPTTSLQAPPSASRIIGVYVVVLPEWQHYNVYTAFLLPPTTNEMPCLTPRPSQEEKGEEMSQVGIASQSCDSRT